jgi:hypothetical protein
MVATPSGWRRSSCSNRSSYGASLAGLRAEPAAAGLRADSRWAPSLTPTTGRPSRRGAARCARAELARRQALEALASIWARLHGGRSLAARAVLLEGGERLRFDGLVIATGASPRRLPATPPLAGIHVLRTLDDCLKLRGELERGPRVVVVGACFIGAEVAASRRQPGLEVELPETLPVPPGRAVPAWETGETLAAIHRDAPV